MKTINYLLTLFCVFVFITACKKDAGTNLSRLDKTRSDVLVAPDGTHLPLTVVTIAGNANQLGYADGPGKRARFFGANGIDVMDDGTIYVADENNNKIRKISPANVVSTVNIPNNSAGHSLVGPARVRVQSDGTINILTYDVYYVISDKIWIVKPNGDVITPVYKTPPPTGSSYNPYTYNDLERDPYSNYLLIGGLFNGYTYAKAVLERFEVKNGAIGTNAYNPPNDSLSTDSKNNPGITSFFCGYNKVKYIVINNKNIYKYTPEGVFTRIHRDLVFANITDIVGNKDNRTIYIADAGKIKSITNGKLTYLAGPQKPYDSGDGVGSSADVHAYQLALSKDEGTLYFTDNNSVRKLLLR